MQIPIIALSQLGSLRASIFSRQRNQSISYISTANFLLALIIVVPIILVIASSQPIQSFLNINSANFINNSYFNIWKFDYCARLILVYLEVMQLPNLIAYSQILSLILGLLSHLLTPKGDK